MSTAETAPVRTGVLRDYPLRLWAEQEEYTQDLLREFDLLLIGEQSGLLREAAPGRLVALAELIQRRFGRLLHSINQERQAAYDRGLDRIDSRIPPVEGAPELLEQVRQVLTAADDFCRQGELLLLPRPPHLVALWDWVRSELLVQYDGGDPTPWSGPLSRGCLSAGRSGPGRSATIARRRPRKDP